MEVFSINNASYSSTNDITLAGSSNTSTYMAHFQFFQDGKFTIINNSLTTQGIINNSTLTQTGAAIFNGITNNTTLTQTGAATFNKITNNTTLTQTGAATFNGITNNGSFTQTGAYIITNSTQSTNTTTGCLHLAGGVGIQKDIFVGGNINGTLIPTNSGVTITGINGNAMILNSASNGVFQFNNNNTEMLRIYKVLAQIILEMEVVIILL